MEVRERIVIFSGSMQPIPAEPDNTFRLIVPGCASMIVSMAQTVHSEIACGWPDCSRSNRIDGPLCFKCPNDGVRTGVGKGRSGVKTEV
jgi:hypothetical protein